MPKEQDLTRVFIGLGSNIEPRFERLQSSIDHLREFGERISSSPVYETAPVGELAQPDFLNAVIEVHTPLGPIDLFHHLKQIEKDLGRKDRPRWHEREIDLDLLFYGDLILESSKLIVPHPESAHRAFVLMPMADLDANFVHPLSNRSVADLLSEVDVSGVRKTNLKLA
jgi:2-amino-4-hydroxy-6-hydroxymethyldihydropteridine diphosphokinase